MLLQQKFMKTAGTENKTTKYNFSNNFLCLYLPCNLVKKFIIQAMFSRKNKETSNPEILIKYWKLQILFVIY